jgi:hypothetical protein
MAFAKSIEGETFNPLPLVGPGRTPLAKLTYLLRVVGLPLPSQAQYSPWKFIKVTVGRRLVHLSNLSPGERWLLQENRSCQSSRLNSMTGASDSGGWKPRKSMFFLTPRLRRTKLLLIGFQSLHAEICKNVILVGVQSITIVDEGIVQPQDLSAHLFLGPDHVGKPVKSIANGLASGILPCCGSGA